MRRRETLESQSAMEYLMTYGWAILIIAVILAALYDIGVFGGITSLGNSCIAVSGFTCTNTTLDSSGLFSFTFGYVGQNITIVGFACTNSTLPPSSFTLSGISALPPDQSENINATCVLPSSALGTRFTGYLWIEYNQNGQNNLKNQFATILTSVTHLAPPGQYLLVSASSQVDVVSLSNDQLAATIPIGSANCAYNIAAVPGSQLAIVGDVCTGNVIEINTGTDSVVNTVNLKYLTAPFGANIEGVAVTPDGSKAIVGLNSGSANEFAIIYTSNMVVAGTVRCICNGYGTAVSPDGTSFYATSSSAQQFYTISTSTYAITNAISICPNGYYIAPFPSGGLASVSCNAGGQTLYTVSASSNTIANTLNAGDLYGLAITPDGSELLASDVSSANVVVVSTSNYVITDQIYLGGFPEYITVNPNGQYAYVVDNGGVNIITLSNDMVTGLITGISPSGGLAVT